MSSTPAQTLEEARGYAELGLFHHAWEMVDDLPPKWRTAPGALAVRLLVATGLSRWELGLELARLFEVSSSESDREIAGGFFFAHARALCLSGDMAAAKKSVSRLSACWPEGRIHVLNDPALDPLFD